MKLLLQSAPKALNPAYRKQPVRREDMERFKARLRASGNIDLRSEVGSDIMAF